MIRKRSPLQDQGPPTPDYKTHTHVHNTGDKSMKADPEGSLEYFSSGATEESEADPLQAGPKVVTATSAKHFKVRLLGMGRSVVGVGLTRAPFVRCPPLQQHQQYQELLAKHPKVVVDYVAGWCGKCKQIMPFVNQLSEDFGGVTFVKVNTEMKMEREVR